MGRSKPERSIPDSRPWRFVNPSAARSLDVVASTFALAVLAGCASSQFASVIDPKYGVATSARVVEPGQPIPKGGGVYRIGSPYTVAGRTYVPEENTHYQAEGMASWYGEDFHGRLTANGEVYDMNGISAAHPTLPLPCYVRVTNLANHRSLIVRVNDRGPYAGNREIDVSGKAAELLGFRSHGLARVRVEYVARAPLDGSDDNRLMATLREGTPAPPPSAVMIASAKPFMPAFDEQSPVLRGSVPVPTQRPYDLEDATSDRLTSGIADGALGSRASAQPMWNDPFARHDTAPVSALTPASYDTSTGISSGRGLY